MNCFCISIVIVTWNKIDYLQDCVESLFNSTYKNFEIIIVDNGSDDGSVEYIMELQKKYPNIKAIFNKENLGFSTPSNQGARIATGDLIFLLNNDTVVDYFCLESVVMFVKENPNVAVIQPRIMQTETIMDEQGNVLMNNGYLLHFGFGEKISPLFYQTYPVFSVKGAAFFVTRKAYEQVGLFRDEYFAFYEETDFCHRCWLAGLPVFYFGGATVQHIGHGTAGEIKKKEPVLIWYQAYRNRLISLFTLLSRKRLFTVLLPHIFMTICSSPVFILLGKKSIFIGIVKSNLYLIANFRSLIKQRKYFKSTLNGFTEDEIFKRFKLFISPPRGYMLSLATNKHHEFWRKSVNVELRNKYIEGLKQKTPTILSYYE